MIVVFWLFSSCHANSAAGFPGSVSDFKRSYKESQTVNWCFHYTECIDVDFVTVCGSMVWGGFFLKPFQEKGVTLLELALTLQTVWCHRIYTICLSMSWFFLMLTVVRLSRTHLLRRDFQSISKEQRGKHFQKIKKMTPY